MYISAKEIAKNYVVNGQDKDFVPAAEFDKVKSELDSLTRSAHASMPPEYKGWATWWFENGGSLNQLWNSRAYKAILELSKKLPKLAWDEQDARVVTILLKYNEALDVIKYYASLKTYIALDSKGLVQHCVLPGTDMEGYDRLENLQVIDGKRTFTKHYAGKTARNFLKKVGG